VNSLPTGAHLDVQLIRHAQANSGAYPACAGFSQYGSSWLRDGSFIAHAMDLAGCRTSSRAFHLWVAATIGRQHEHIRAIIRRHQSGESLAYNEMLPARYGLDGSWEQDEWPNYQLDGYGHWLWAIAEHLKSEKHDGLPDLLRPAAQDAADYLVEFWRENCSDCWEEAPDATHTATLASIYGGLRAAENLGLVPLGKAEEVRTYILKKCVEDGCFVKSSTNRAVDGSLVWVSTPFEVVPPEHPLIRRTVEVIERTLVRDGGVIRYDGDSYYGAGAWLLLTDFLAWHLARDGRVEEARQYHGWAEAQRDALGRLPEQVPVRSTDAQWLVHWTARWGESAKPLLWSHAMHLITRFALLPVTQ
jgi:GH15 family glucan-1,4-alpha-glucosidase